MDYVYETFGVEILSETEGLNLLFLNTWNKPLPSFFYFFCFEILIFNLKTIVFGLLLWRTKRDLKAIRRKGCAIFNCTSFLFLIFRVAIT